MKKKQIEVPTINPLNNTEFFGHKEAINTLSYVMNNSKMPNAFLLTGQKGIGKATLAYRFARYLLAEKSERTENFQISENCSTFQKIIAGSHPNLLIISPNETSKSGDIKIEEARTITPFLAMTSSGNKPRVIIIDSIDDMNMNAANSVLKLLEEPPLGTIFLLISHAPGKLLPTIKSRCRLIRMLPLSIEHSAQVINYLRPDINNEDIKMLSKISDGAPGLAIELFDNGGIDIYNQIINIMADYPRLNREKLLKFVDEKELNNSLLILKFILSEIIKIKAQNIDSEINSINSLKKNKLIIEKTLEQFFKIWDKVNSLWGDANRVNLDKRIVLISIFEFIFNP